MRNSSLSSKRPEENKSRIVVSFRIDKQLWLDFDKYVTDSHGNYKKSPLLESLIRKYISNHKDSVQTWKDKKMDELSRL